MFCVWLPLNGNLDNQGLADVTVTNGTPAYRSNGKTNLYGLDLSKKVTLNCPKLRDCTQFSVSFWIKLEDDGGIITDWQDIISFIDQKSDNSATGAFRAESCYNNTTDYAGVHWHDDSTFAISTGSLPRHYSGDRGVWHHCAITVDSNQEIKGYTDGVLIDTYTASGGGHLTGIFSIGENDLIKGIINDVRIWDHVITSQEIKYISQGLILHYKLSGIGDSNSSYTPLVFNNSIEYDVSGFGNDGSKIGTITTNSDTARYITSYAFNGASYIHNGTAAKAVDAITVNIWVKYTDWGGVISCPGSWDFNTINNYVSFRIYISGIGYVNSSSTETSTNLSDGKWHMLTGTFDKTNVKIYIDGILKNTQSTNSANGISYNENSVIFIGRSGESTPAYINGSLVDARVYATCLSADDIESLYSMGGSINSTGTFYAYEYVEEQE